MNIGIVTTWFERGAAMVSRAYHDLLSRAGHRVYIFARAGEAKARSDPRWNSPEVTWGDPVWGEGSTNFHYAQFRRWVRQRRLDLLIFNEQNYWPPLVRARRDLHIPLVAYVDYYTETTVPFFALYDALLCNTRRHHRVFAWHKQAWLIPWGTDCHLFTGSCEPVCPGSVVFFHSAGVNPLRKGTALALEAFTRLPGNHRFVLHIQPPLSQWPGLVNLCQRDRRIEVINRTVPAPGLYHRGDVLVYPTQLEGIGLTIAEALASGLPVITTNTPPMNEFVEHGRNGWLVSPVEYRARSDGYYWALSICDVAAVHQAMTEVVLRVDDLPRLKAQARTGAMDRLDWFKNARDLPGRLVELARHPPPREDLRDLAAEALACSDLPPSRFIARGLLRALGRDRDDWAIRVLYG